MICKESRIHISLHIPRFAHRNLHRCKISMGATFSEIKLIEVGFSRCHTAEKEDASKRITHDLALRAIQNWVLDSVVVITTTEMAHVYRIWPDYCGLQVRMTTIHEERVTDSEFPVTGQRSFLNILASKQEPQCYLTARCSPANDSERRNIFPPQSTKT